MPPDENLSKIERIETKLHQTRPHLALVSNTAVRRESLRHGLSRSIFSITQTSWVKENASDDAIKRPAQEEQPF